MTKRVTRSEVEWQVQRLTVHMVEMRIIPMDAKVELTVGSKTNGVAWRLRYISPDGNGGQGLFSSGGYLGMTATECYHTLYHYIQVLQFIRYETPRIMGNDLDGWGRLPVQQDTGQ